MFLTKITYRVIGNELLELFIFGIKRYNKSLS